MAVFLAVAAGALALYVAVMSVGGIRASIPVSGEDQMARQEVRDRIGICACAVIASLGLAGLAVSVVLAPGWAASVLEAPENWALAAATILSLAAGTFAVREYIQMREHWLRIVPVVYAAFFWSALVLAYAVAAL